MITDDNLRDALQGMRQPQPGVVRIADVLAYVEPALEKLRREVADLRDGAENRRLRHEVARVNGILEYGKKDIEKLVERFCEAEADRDRARALTARINEWANGDVVTAKSSFGDGYREAMRDIRDLIKGGEG